jgi:hypothetical protein
MSLLSKTLTMASQEGYHEGEVKEEVLRTITWMIPWKPRHRKNFKSNIKNRKPLE